jgi:hypothetical protein
MVRRSLSQPRSVLLVFAEPCLNSKDCQEWVLYIGLLVALKSLKDKMKKDEYKKGKKKLKKDLKDFRNRKIKYKDPR